MLEITEDQYHYLFRKVPLIKHSVLSSPILDNYGMIDGYEFYILRWTIGSYDNPHKPLLITGIYL